jgi:hypothetical protein
MEVVVGMAIAGRAEEGFLAGLHVLTVVFVFERLSVRQRRWVTALPRAQSAAQGFKLGKIVGRRRWRGLCHCWRGGVANAGRRLDRFPLAFVSGGEPPLLRRLRVRRGGWLRLPYVRLPHHDSLLGKGVARLTSLGIESVGLPGLRICAA